MAINLDKLEIKNFKLYKYKLTADNTMTISDEVVYDTAVSGPLTARQAIEKEFNVFKEFMYANSPDDVRDELGQFFTPTKISTDMIESYNITSLSGKRILDPCCGSGNLLAACLIAGADSDKVFGNDYDARMVKAAYERLNIVCDILGKAKLSRIQIHRGNAAQARCLKEFSEVYDAGYNDKYINDPLYAQSLPYTVNDGLFPMPVEQLTWDVENRAAEKRWKEEQAKLKRAEINRNNKNNKQDKPSLFDKEHNC